MANINFKEWLKTDLRVGKILKAEDIEGADKLYKLEIDLGGELGKRTICAGIKEHYSKKELDGKKIIVIVNLEPREIKEIESKGMLLAAVSDDKKEVVLLSPEKDVKEGMKVS
ncbi:MAG: methionine--tRNA ligase subunit beta [Nanoarchaeota archaeon]|nr:methionine--tRNA ligase subunit beta [Nanoarchaeota archaeon]